MGINRVVGMCTSSNRKNHTRTTMLLLLTPWDLTHLTTLEMLFNIL
jgi:hypothetical protein